MTAIAGFACADGVVIAAEAEETYQDNKVYTNKLFHSTRETWKAGIAGSGSGYLIDYAKEKIFHAIDAGNPSTVTECESRISQILDGLYRNEFTAFPISQKSDLMVQLLISVQFAKDGNWGEAVLFESQANLVTRLKRGQAKILGVGELLKETASQLSNWGLTAELAEWASIYLIHDAKRRFGGVGGWTQVHTLLDNGTHKMRADTSIAQIEVLLGIAPRIEQLLMLSLCPSITDDKSKDFIDAVKTWFSAARKEIKKIHKDHATAKYRKITIGSREMEKFVKGITKGTKRSASQKSEPEK
jgi:hypothetical protein